MSSTSMAFKLRPGQSEAVDQIDDWYVDSTLRGRSKQSFFLAGYAGTGKSTIVEAIVKRMKLTAENTVIVSTTGKATLVLNNKLKQYTALRAVTIHGLLYFPRVVKELTKVAKLTAAESGSNNDKDKDVILGPDEVSAFASKPQYVTEKKLQFSMKDRHKQLEGIKLIIVDEASMMNEKLYYDLLSFGIQVLFIGDTAQLPPVRSKVMLKDPDYALTEIMRQGKGSMIAALAEYVRDTGGQVWAPGVYGENKEVQIITRQEFNQDLAFRRAAMMHADQIICGMNKTRDLLNKEVRSYFGHNTVLPEIGDKLICLKNNKDIWINGVYAVNGQLGVVEAVHHGRGRSLKRGSQTTTYIEFLAEGAKQPDTIEIHDAPFEALSKGVKIDPYDLSSEPGYFDYGNVITCHKAQGSEWDNILVFAEAWHKDTRMEWMNTAITRASKKIILVV